MMDEIFEHTFKGVSNYNQRKEKHESRFLYVTSLSDYKVIVFPFDIWVGFSTLRSLVKNFSKINP